MGQVDFNLLTRFSFQQYASKMELYLYDLLHNHRSELSATDQLFGGILVDVLKECGMRSFNPDVDDPQAAKILQEVRVIMGSREVIISDPSRCKLFIKTFME